MPVQASDRMPLTQEPHQTASPLAGFGIERVCGAAPLWNERLTVDEHGAVRLRTLRSLSDASGVPIGVFARQDDREVLARLLQALDEMTWPAAPTLAPRPYELHVRLSLMIGGELRTITIPAKPQLLAPLSPLLDLLDLLTIEALQHPKHSLVLSAECDLPRRQGLQDLTIALTLRNDGDSGYWIPSPSGATGDETVSCALSYSVLPQPAPGVTPLPVVARTAVLSPVTAPEQSLIWIRPCSTHALILRTQVDLDRAGPWSARVGFASYSGEDTIAGRPRMRGCAFSNEVRICV